MKLSLNSNFYLKFRASSNKWDWVNYKYHFFITFIYYSIKVIEKKESFVIILMLEMRNCYAL